MCGVWLGNAVGEERMGKRWGGEGGGGEVKCTRDIMEKDIDKVKNFFLGGWVGRKVGKG